MRGEVGRGEVLGVRWVGWDVRGEVGRGGV